VHGDTPGAYEMLTAIRHRLEAGGIALKAFAR
jgi:lactam utilization protein B